MADEKPPKIKGNKPNANSEDRFPNPRSWMLWALGIFIVVMLFQVGKTANSTPTEKVDFATLHGWINSGQEVKGYIEYPPPTPPHSAPSPGTALRAAKKSRSRSMTG